VVSDVKGIFELEVMARLGSGVSVELEPSPVQFASVSSARMFLRCNYGWWALWLAMSSLFAGGLLAMSNDELTWSRFDFSFVQIEPNTRWRWQKMTQRLLGGIHCLFGALCVRFHATAIVLRFDHWHWQVLWPNIKLQHIHVIVSIFTAFSTSSISFQV
jgi:hypothetical protein